MNNMEENTSLPKGVTVAYGDCGKCPYLGGCSICDHPELKAALFKIEELKIEIAQLRAFKGLESVQQEGARSKARYAMAKLREMARTDWAARYEHDYFFLQAADAIQDVIDPNASPSSNVREGG